MASEGDSASDSLDVSVDDVPDILLDYIKSKVIDYMTNEKNLAAKIHRVKGQSPRLVLYFGPKPSQQAQVSSNNTGDSEKTKTILVMNLPTSVDEDLLEVFFESTKKQGGGPVKSVTIISERNVAFVEFYECSAVETVLKKRPIKFGKTELDIQPYKPFLTSSEIISHVDVKGLHVLKGFTDGLLEVHLDSVSPKKESVRLLSSIALRHRSTNFLT